MEGSTEKKKLVEVFIDTDSESESYTSSEERSRVSEGPEEEVLSTEEVYAVSEEGKEEMEGEESGGSADDVGDMLPLPHAKQDGESTT